MTRVDVKPLFPVPFMRVSGLLPTALVARCINDVQAADTRSNARSDLLRHTSLNDASTTDSYRQVADLVGPYLVQFGKLLFGERLSWFMKEIWSNVLEPGGHQAIHAHSNSFASGIIYLTDSHPSARTVFHRNLGGREFIFSNENPRAEIGPFNGNKWVTPEMRPGDMVLYPSYLLHEVPRNEGARRLTLAFNAIPERLDTWGYAVQFSPRATGEGEGRS